MIPNGSKLSLENTNFHENLFISIILVIFQTSTTNGRRLSFENPYFPSHMFILAIEWLTVNLISIHERYGHLLENCVKIGSHEVIHIIVKNI